MRVFKLSINDINKKVSNIIKEEINKHDKYVLGLATGSSPLGVYKELVNFYNNKEVNFSNVISFNLDEYSLLDEDNPQSYHYFMNEHLFKYINLKEHHVPSKNINSIDYYKNYDALIKSKGGIDLQILGIGSDGHIAFNEPGTNFDSLTHEVSLKESTIKDNSRFFSSINEVPTHAITMGLLSIMNARKIILIAAGKGKTSILKKFLSDDIIDVNIPVSILKKHKDVSIYIDKKVYSLTE